MLGEFEIYRHNKPEITTITDYLNSDNSLASDFVGDKVGFLEYDGGTGITNLDRLIAGYTQEERQNNSSTAATAELLKPNTLLLIPKSRINKEVLSIIGKDQFVIQSNFRTFYGQSLLQLLSDPLYTPSSTFQYDDKNVATSISPQASVWIYSKAIDSIINVSSYVLSCTTSVTKEGGSFKVILPPVVSLNEQLSINSGVGNRYTLNHVFRDSKGTKNDFVFHRLIQNNDIVFIKFEQLQIERDERITDFILDKAVLSEQFYDMIGLVDTNDISTAYQTNEVTIDISGRDLMKLLIDDGSYFFPLQFVEGADDVFVNLQDDDKLIQRLFSTGRYEALFTYSFRSIVDTIQFIFNQLGNLGVVGDNEELFSAYGDRRTKIYRLQNEADPGSILHNGIWQIIKLLVDGNVSDRRIADESIGQPDGQLISQVQKICQEPYVEFFGDTYGDFYNFIVRQPPYTGSQILSIVDNTVSDQNLVTAQNEGLIIPSDILEKNTTDLILNINDSDVIQDSLGWESTHIYSWYEIKPEAAFIGNQDTLSLAFIPIVYFPQYANRWGMKRMSTVTNYISYQSLTGTTGDTNRDLFREAVLNDYKYLIDSYAYLPFTRTGTIVINGDRRIKRGTWIRYVSTGEIFYVTSVTNNFGISDVNIDRTTTLTLTRGMKEDHLRGEMSYFNIIDTGLIRDVLLERLRGGGSSESRSRVNVKSNFGVNEDVFQYFLQRNQFD